MTTATIKSWYGSLTPRRRAAWVFVAAILVLGFYLTIRRFFIGLGDVTNLNDSFPWGLWIGFDVISGVALAAGGFTLCAIVYIFGYHRYHSIVRPTVLTAFLGYILVAIGLMYDLGKYYNIWHPIVMWNPHSVMFEVGWCVILYTSVLFLEFLPIILEKFEVKSPFARKLNHILGRAAIPIVLAGVILSTLHQSSLGSVYLIVPDKLHTLWYTPILPLLFFLSAVAVGPAMVIFESWASSRLFRRGLELDIIADLARFLQVGLIVYLGVRIQDLFVRGVVGEVFSGSFESFHFMAEIGLLLLAFLILANRKMRASRKWLPFASFLVVWGIVYNRINVAWIGMLRGTGGDYFPAWEEFALSLFLVTCGALAFYFIAKHFPVFPEIEEGQEHKHS